MSKEVKVAIIGGAALVVGAIIQSVFGPLSQGVFKSEEKPPAVFQNNNHVTVPVNVYPDNHSQEQLNELRKKTEDAENAAKLATERAARAEEQVKQTQENLQKLSPKKESVKSAPPSSTYTGLSNGDCCIVRLAGGEARIMFRTRPLSSSEVAAVNRDHGSVAQETEIADGLYNGQQVTFLSKEGKFYKIKAYIQKEGRYRTGYFSATLFGIDTLVRC